MSTKSTSTKAKAAATATAAATETSAAEPQVTSTAAAVQAIITPTVGRRVYYWPNEEDQARFGVFDAQQPCDAGILYVWGDREVNLEVTGPSGVKHTVQNVQLLQGDDEAPEGKTFAAWMPYQRSQAAASA